jgi:hypothetical protein
LNCCDSPKASQGDVKQDLLTPIEKGPHDGNTGKSNPMSQGNEQIGSHHKQGGKPNQKRNDDSNNNSNSKACNMNLEQTNEKTE